MVMIARVNIHQFVLFSSIIFNRHCSEPVQASSDVQAFVVRLSKVGNKMVDIVNKNSWKDYFVNCDINPFWSVFEQLVVPKPNTELLYLK